MASPEGYGEVDHELAAELGDHVPRLQRRRTEERKVRSSAGWSSESSPSHAAQRPRREKRRRGTSGMRNEQPKDQAERVTVANEIEIIQPKVILCFGLNHFFHDNSENVEEFRKFDDFVSSENFTHCQVYSTHSVGDLMKNASLKKQSWEDMQKVMKCLD